MSHSRWSLGEGGRIALRWSLLAAAIGVVAEPGCANGSSESNTPPCVIPFCPDNGGDDSGAASSDPTSGGPDTGTPAPPSSGDDSGTGDDSSTGAIDSSTPPPPPSGDAGNWVNMTGNAMGCDNKPGVPCGWSASNNGVGDLCACRHGTWADGWSCEAPNAPVTAGASCPGVVGTDDAGSNSNDSGGGGVPDASKILDAGGNQDAGGWIDMSNAPTGCDNHPGTPCGWTTTNMGQGYTCACRHGDWADGWTCEAAGATVTPGPSCP